VQALSPGDAARRHVRSILELAIEHSGARRALILFDGESPLSSLLAEAYRDALPDAPACDASRLTAAEAFRKIDALAPADLVVLVESSRFPLAEHRFRIELFDRGLKVVEHPHLARIRDEEIAAYVDALAYDPAYYRTVGPALKRRIDRADRIRVAGAEGELVYTSAFEEAKLNVGDYRGQKNTGGQFPIGEVFTEPIDLARVNGEIPLFAFGDSGFGVAAPENPIRLRVEAGVVVEAKDAPPDFDGILSAIRAQEGVVHVRELGFGLNRALTRSRRVSDVGSYERMCGVHLSLGAKHAIYAKAGFPKRKTKFHVDVFVAVERVEIGGEMVFSDGAYRIEDALRS